MILTYLLTYLLRLYVREDDTLEVDDEWRKDYLIERISWSAEHDRFQLECAELGKDGKRIPSHLLGDGSTNPVKLQGYGLGMVPRQGFIMKPRKEPAEQEALQLIVQRFELALVAVLGERDRQEVSIAR